mmetsp:Transcript_60459/g.180066  ORF Transcript_60459/g.180066 Transcript_60459/m.180066 type:complete len:259 (+) Transcript_60459:1569-2345(+)
MVTSRSTQSAEPSPPQDASWPSRRQLECTSSRLSAPSSACLVSPSPPVTNLESSYRRSRSACRDTLPLPPAPSASSTSQTSGRRSLSLLRPSQAAARTAASVSPPGSRSCRALEQRARPLAVGSSIRSSSHAANTAPARLELPAGASRAVFTLVNHFCMGPPDACANCSHSVPRTRAPIRRARLAAAPPSRNSDPQEAPVPSSASSARRTTASRRLGWPLARQAANRRPFSPNSRRVAPSSIVSVVAEAVPSTTSAKT